MSGRIAIEDPILARIAERIAVHNRVIANAVSKGPVDVGFVALGFTCHLKHIPLQLPDGIPDLDRQFTFTPDEIYTMIAVICQHAPVTKDSQFGDQFETFILNLHDHVTPELLREVVDKIDHRFNWLKKYAQNGIQEIERHAKQDTASALFASAPSSASHLSDAAAPSASPDAKRSVAPQDNSYAEEYLAQVQQNHLDAVQNHAITQQLRTLFNIRSATFGFSDLVTAITGYYEHLNSERTSETRKIDKKLSTVLPHSMSALQFFRQLKSNLPDEAQKTLKQEEEKRKLQAEEERKQREEKRKRDGFYFSRF